MNNRGENKTSNHNYHFSSINTDNMNILNNILNIYQVIGRSIKIPFKRYYAAVLMDFMQVRHKKFWEALANKRKKVASGIL